jgi:GTPase SAR1 family protein
MTIKLSLWGPTSAGKTVLLARLYQDWDGHGRGWSIYPTEKAESFIESMRNHLVSKNRFPPSTVSERQEVAYELRHRANNRSALLSIEDRAGKDYERLEEDVKERLKEAQGLVLLFDPLADDYVKLGRQVEETVEKLYLDLRPPKGYDERPVAICLTKVDRLLDSVDDLERLRKDPHRFATRWVCKHLGAKLLTKIEQYYSNYRFFPLSSIGVMAYGRVLDPVTFIDENLEERILPHTEPLNLSLPFLWILDELDAD